MSLFTKIQTAIENNNADKWLELYHEDFEFVRHKSGTSMNREEIHQMIKRMFASGAVVQEDHRCLYENEDILVEHSFMDFPDGSREAVLVVHQIKNGKIIRTETGATPISK
jgi:hypothetical protein